MHQKFCQNFDSYSICEEEMLKTQEFVLNKYGVRVCPHTSIALASAMQNKEQQQIKLCLATASYKKFIP